MTISVVLPVYGVEKYIRKAVASLCAQTMQDFELILVDDGSPDRSIEIALEEIGQAKAAFSVRVLRQENAGVSAARNAGMRAAGGDWVICIDPDDTIHPQTLEALCRAMADTAQDYDVYGFGFRYVRTAQDSFPQIALPCAYLRYTREEILDAYLRREQPLISPALLIRRSFLVSRQLEYPPELRFSEDMLFIWKLLYAAEGLCFLDYPFYAYLLHPGSTMSASPLPKILSGYRGFAAFDEQLRAERPDERLAAWILPRWILGTLRSAAQMLSFEDFCALAEKVQYRTNMRRLRGFPDRRAAVLARLLLLSRRAFYLAVRRFIPTA